MPHKLKNITQDKLVKEPLKGLFEFLKEHSVIGMAFGVIVAQISKDLVDALVKGVFTPLISLVIPGRSLEKLSIIVNGSRFDFGVVISAFLTFLIVMTFIYILVKKILNRSDLLAKKD